MSEDEPTDAQVNVQLAILSNAAQRGASDESLKMLAAQLRGDEMIAVTERGGGTVHVVVQRVRSVGPAYPDGTVLDFDGLPLHHPKRTLTVEDDQHKVVRRLREKGWKY